MQRSCPFTAGMLIGLALLVGKVGSAAAKRLR